MRRQRSTVRSPLRERPLNNAAESQQEYLSGTILGEELAPWVAVCVMALVMAGLEWFRALTKSPPAPMAMTLLALVVIIIFFAWKLPHILRRARQAGLAIEGEKAVGHLLEDLRAGGYRVFHDIVEDGYNIDHVLIGSTGVYVIETKTRSKSDARRDVHVVYDGHRILVDGHAPDRDPLKQVQALADRVAEILHTGTGMRPPIRPVVLFPGWFVEPQPKGTAIWVLNPKNLPKFVAQERRCVEEAGVAVLAAALETHVRASLTRA